MHSICCWTTETGVLSEIPHHLILSSLWTENNSDDIVCESRNVSLIPSARSYGTVWHELPSSETLFTASTRDRRGNYIDLCRAFDIVSIKAAVGRWVPRYVRERDLLRHGFYGFVFLSYVHWPAGSMLYNCIRLGKQTPYEHTRIYQSTMVTCETNSIHISTSCSQTMLPFTRCTIHKITLILCYELF